jgi:hypothetical protein
LGLRSKSEEESQRAEWEGWIKMGPTPGAEFPIMGHARRYRGLGNAQKLSVRWWRWSWIVCLISGTFLTAAWVVRRTSWQNRIGLALLTALLSGVIGANDGDLLRHLFEASRFGLGAVLVLWGFQDLKRFGGRLFRRSEQPGGIETPWGVVTAPVIPPPGVFPRRSGAEFGDQKSS